MLWPVLALTNFWAIWSSAPLTQSFRTLTTKHACVHDLENKKFGSFRNAFIRKKIVFIFRVKLGFISSMDTWLGYFSLIWRTSSVFPFLWKIDEIKCFVFVSAVSTLLPQNEILGKVHWRIFSQAYPYIADIADMQVRRQSYNKSANNKTAKQACVCPPGPPGQVDT